MKAVVIHAPHDLRLDDWAAEPPQLDDDLRGVDPGADPLEQRPHRLGPAVDEGGNQAGHRSHLGHRMPGHQVPEGFRVEANL